ncbi:MAG TPA: hypothetical protein PKW44_01925 [Methylophilaceae bacterium]|nr:hypothetical protein [Methylophilaceae bacterium]HQR61379.1 hypothetical protein [Methylophilaceae bacterium]
MDKSKVKSLAIIFLLSILTVFPAFVSQVAARVVAVEGPRGDEAVAVEGPRGNVAVGTRVDVLPDTASPVVVRGTQYYVDGGVYYKPDDSGAYVVVTAPE